MYEKRLTIIDFHTKNENYSQCHQSVKQALFPFAFIISSLKSLSHTLRTCYQPMFKLDYMQQINCIAELKMNSSLSVSEQNGDIRYHKAIKEISKLININNNTKKEYNALQKKYEDLAQELQATRNRLMVYEGGNKGYNGGVSLDVLGEDEQNFTINVRVENKALKQSQEQSPHNVANSLLFKSKELENTGTISEYHERKQLLANLQSELKQKNQLVDELKAQLTQKNTQINELLEKQNNYLNEVLELKAKLSKSYSEEQIKAIEDQKSELESEVLRRQQIIDKLTQQCRNLKDTYSKQSSVTFEPVKNRNFGLNRFDSTYEEGEKIHARDPPKKEMLAEFYQKKSKTLQAENMRINQQFAQKKAKYKGQIVKLREQADVKQQNIQQMLRFIEKQQNFIEQYAQKYKIGVQTKPKNQITLKNQTNDDSIIKNLHQVATPTSNVSGVNNFKQGFKNHRINTIQSQQYTITLSQALKGNYQLKKQQKTVAKLPIGFNKF